ncbi:peptidase M13 [Sphingomonas sp. Leaf231]|uniref:M13 family metallopeptidase n=1 Tax=Sphingomonas sp. Leaf231 TaxID=1736301 RepID=UPI0006F65827|nr:M13 family metallopeptidase [Sphingomonas sp. Leaf231]KQN93537.1 peptidase M13 [Sphingomonas sp. Leaf231]
MRFTVVTLTSLLALLPAALLAQSAPPASAPAVPSATPSGDGPTYGTFGFDAAGMDRAVKPGDDFYAFANGTWAKNTAIPADESNYGAFNVLQDLSRERTRGILEAAKGDPASKIGRAYAAYLDTAAIERAGLAPIQPWLTKIRRVDKAGYPALLAEADRNGVDIPFGLYVGQDDKDPDVYAVNLMQGGLGMPDRDYYLATDARLAQTRAAYQAHLAKLLTLAGERDAAPRAAALLAFETELARVHWTRIDSRDADKTYNKMMLEQLRASAPGFDFDAFLKAERASAPTLIVAQPTAIAGTAKLIAATPIGVLRDQLLVRSLDGFADVLPRAVDQESFAFNGTALSGTPQQQERWKRAVGFTSSALNDEVSKIYVARYFPPETKAAADTMVKNVLTALGRRVEALDWMAPETKVKAQAKLAAFTSRIGYPERWRDYSNLDVRAGDAFGNMMRANQWRHDYNVTKLGKPIYRWEWGMSPMLVNAQANFGLVAITFPAAILQPPFFDPKADPAVNYGGIGAVIGHEMSHHFDDQGAKYDARGRLTQWWTDADVQKFKALSERLVKQYDAYEPLPGMHVKGELTLGENSADLAGLAAAHDAYVATLGGKPAPVIDGFTGDQRFYLGWAQVWRRNYREASLRQRLLTDPHAPSEQRGNIVRNMDPWYSAYKAQAGEKLYLAPDARARIW